MSRVKFIRRFRRKDGRWFDPRLWIVNILLFIAYVLNGDAAEEEYQRIFHP